MGIKISALPSIVTPALTDVFPVSQGNTTYKETITQLFSLLASGSGAALTRTNDTNVTVTLGGSPTTALLNAASLTLGWTGTLAVTRGGTGLASTTVNQLLYSSATSTIAGLATTNRASLSTNATGVPTWLALTDGQIVVGSSAGAPAAATLTAGTGISIANASNGITINATAGGLAVATISGTTQTAVVNTMYIALNAGQTTVTLPSTYAVGDTVVLVGSGANTGGWILDAPAGDTIMYNGTATSSGGTITSAAAAGQTIDVVADVANTSWVVVDTVNITLTTA